MYMGSLDLGCPNTYPNKWDSNKLSYEIVLLQCNKAILLYKISIKSTTISIGSLFIQLFGLSKHTFKQMRLKKTLTWDLSYCYYTKSPPSINLVENFYWEFIYIIVGHVLLTYLFGFLPVKIQKAGKKKKKKTEIPLLLC